LLDGEFTIMRKIIGLIGSAALMVAAHQVSAAQINGTISIDGQNTFTSNSISYDEPGDLGGVTGDFTALTPCHSCVDQTSFNSSSTNSMIFSVYQNGEQGDFMQNGTPFTFDYTHGNPLDSLVITGTGLATLNGFEPTPGNITITTQGIGGDSKDEFTFSATAITTPNSVPEPATLSIFGLGLLVLGIVKWKWKFPVKIA
jgi:hypothetical protein